MKKYISVLILAAMAGTAMAQQTLQPKHLGIMARQMEQRQMKIEVSPVQKLTQTIKPVVTTRATVYEDIKIDSVYVKKLGKVQSIQYRNYYSNGNNAKWITMGFDKDDNMIETGRTEWTEDSPLKGSSMTEYGFDSLGVYGPIYKIELHDDYGNSYCEYKGAGGELKPVERLSTTLNENFDKVTEAYYYYDENGKELPEDSIVYAYDEQNRLVRETYFLADQNGKMEELGYFETTYTEIETPSGPGTLIRLMDSYEIYRQDSIYSNDRNYQYFAFYTNEDKADWKIREERSTQNFGDTGLYLRFRYNDDNSVLYGEKQESEYKSEDDLTTNKTLFYSCDADTTTWKLVRRIEDFYYTSESEYSRENSNHQTFIDEPDENGELQLVLLVNVVGTWTGEYVYYESEVYDEEEWVEKETIYYYHDPSVTGINAIKVQTEDGMQFDLEGRSVTAPANGFFVRNGKVVMIRK